MIKIRKRNGWNKRMVVYVRMMVKISLVGCSGIVVEMEWGGWVVGRVDGCGDDGGV